MVELNPFDEWTDSALFSWIRHKHRLRNGPFEFKYIQKAKDDKKTAWWKVLLLPHCRPSAAPTHTAGVPQSSEDQYS